MSTQEERLTVVEYGLKQFKTETIKAYQDMPLEMTMVKGLTEDAVKRLMKLKTQMEERFDSVDQRFDGVDLRLDSIDLRLDSMDQHFGSVDRRLDSMDQRLSTVETLLTQILARLPEAP